MFENLSERLERSWKILKGEGKITEINIAETLKDVRRALLDADVNYKVAKSFCDTVKQKALGQNVLTAVKPQQLMVKIVHDELAALMEEKPPSSICPDASATPQSSLWQVSTVPVRPPCQASSPRCSGTRNPRNPCLQHATPSVLPLWSSCASWASR